MRRLAACFALPVTLLLALGAATTMARAQTPLPGPTPSGGQRGIFLRLVHQTPWNDPRHTKLDLTVRAINHTDTPLDSLSIAVIVFTHVGSRSEYELSLRADTGEPVIANTPSESGSIAPGRSRTFQLPPTHLGDLAQFGVSAIYPMRVDLRSHDQTVATLRSPVIFLENPKPLVPIDLTWTFVLSAPILYEPDGTFRAAWLQREVASGGAMRAQVGALANLESAPAPPSVDVAVSPQLVAQLLQMRRGYTLRTAAGVKHVPAHRGGAAAADQVVRGLRSIAASTSAEVSAMPYSNPSIPSLIRSGLAGDLSTQLSLGSRTLRIALGHAPAIGVLHPPGSRLDQASLFALHQNGIRTLLVDDQTVEEPSPPPRALGFAKPAVAPLSVGSSSLEAIVPDHGVEQLLQSALPAQDSHLAVQAVLGELASVWLERPSVPRGMAAILSEQVRAPGFFYGPLVHAVAQAPWLRLIRASGLAAVHPPVTDRPADLVARPGPTFSPSYVDALNGARNEITTYRSVISDDTALPARLDRLVLAAEAGQFASDETSGRAFLSAVTARLQNELTLVRPNTASVITLTSRTGNVVIPIQNRTGHSVKVQVLLESNRLFPDPSGRSPPQLVQVPDNGTVLTFHVQARTTGRFPVIVKILTPDGSLLSQGRLVVRSTAYNRVALVITIGAALFLLAMWARRLIPWTKR